MSKTLQYVEHGGSNNHINLVNKYDEYYDYDDDVCESCQINTTLYSCNKCGNGICDDVECSLIFPHYHNTTYFVCKSCVDTISQNLILQIDLGKLELLKEKIRSGTTCNSVCSSRTTSRSSCYSNNTVSSLSDISNTYSDQRFGLNFTTSSSSSNSSDEGT